MNGKTQITILLILVLSTMQCFAQKSDIIIADFEGSTYDNWQQVGVAFGSKPSKKGTNLQKELTNFEGNGYANSCAGGLTVRGSLTSPTFVINRPYINFLISGYKSPQKACIKLILEGKTVRSSTGRCEYSYKNERLEWATWDVSEFIGKNASIVIMGGGFGPEHINIDAISQSTIKRELPQTIKEIDVRHPYLHFSIRNDSSERKVKFIVNGKTVKECILQLANGNPDAVVYSDVSAYKGMKMRIEIDHFPNPEVLNKVVQSDFLPGAEEIYNEKYRPQFHFSPRRGWVGDPNGLIYYMGEYHLFYQHNPYGIKWGNMHWGHAVSKDLVHWKELPITLYPREFGDDPYSGSAVVDSLNASGFKTGLNNPLILFYTSTRRGVCISYSNDKGRTFTEYSGNPVLKLGGSDPKVIWHEPTKQWVMVTFTKISSEKFDKSSGFTFYTSTDLKNWKKNSRIEDYWECPELFELPVDRDKKNTKWIVYSNTTPSLSSINNRVGGRYVIGSFDGKTFTEESAKLQFNYGNIYGAAQSYNNIPVADGRRINIGCAFRLQTPGMPFAQMMNFPTELTLQTTEEGVRLFAMPIKEIKSLYVKSINFPNIELKPQANVLPGVEGDLFDINAEFSIGNKTQELGLNIREIPIKFNAITNQLTCGDCTATLKPIGGLIKLRILVDRTSIEIFANDGRVYMPIGVVPNDSARSISVFSKGGDTKIKVLTVNLLKSAWEK